MNRIKDSSFPVWNTVLLIAVVFAAFILPMYFSFVSLATLGYGDVLPLKPYTRSLMTWITISGQFYIAIIVALLVGKFSAQAGNEGDKEES